jgi:hypothetical protein
MLNVGFTGLNACKKEKAVDIVSTAPHVNEG